MKLLVCALETSSNIHLKELVKHLNNDIELMGIFDKNLGDSKYDISSLAIMGFLDVIKKIPFFLKLSNEIVGLASKADKILLMDASGFNLHLAKKIKNKYPNKEIIYYILPQAWAWKQKRILRIEKYCDTLLSILPFETTFYSKKANIQYVGHPLLDEIKTCKNKVSHSNKIAFMPGSRKGEIKQLMPIFIQVARKIDKEPILVIPPNFTQSYVSKIYGDTSLFIISRDAHKTLNEVDFAFICSGTATLEASIIGTPLILSYIAKPLDYLIGRYFVKLKHIGLANIFFEYIDKTTIHPEFFQKDVTAHNLITTYNCINNNKFLENSKTLRDYLQCGSSKKVASIINSSSI
ncbi:Lipid-A-disaccharide synthase [hydrothermal vent metagenome]|uniref:lipid-A-disaccharide synthase n=1 Tax=hydrothermal vent metagenome TaxID=652676 RepID=A0A3B1DXL5_9ZZZZ